MFEQRIGKKEFLRDPFEAATEVLLGSYLCSTIGGKLTAGRITELEVYIGAEDKACHAYLNRKTPRNAAMFETGGCAYVFFVYGMYNQFNVVLNEAGTANAALIRGLEPIAGIETMQERRGTDRLDNLTTGPGKLCQALGIGREQNGVDLGGDLLWLAPRDRDFAWAATPRIGIDYAEEYVEKPWRFVIKGSPFVSKMPKKGKKE